MATSQAYDDFTVIHPQAPSDTVYGDFEKHSTAARTSTDLMISSSLRNRYPDHTLAITLEYDCNLLAFAAAGQAEALLDPSGDESLLYRSFVPPPRRLDGAVGYLVNRVQFAKYYYRWQNHDFLVYVVSGDRGNAGLGVSVLNYILHKPEDHGSVKPITPPTDKLIAAAAQYSLELHKEILVFDQGRWQKNHELWESVQKAAWSDVILDETMKRSLIADVEGFFDERENYREFAVPWKVPFALPNVSILPCCSLCYCFSCVSDDLFTDSSISFSGGKRGILFHGPPGNGKTISIEALMKTLSTRPDPIPTLYVKTFTSFAGPEYAIRQIFVKARAQAPCLLVFEDLDSLVREDVRSYFLNEVDGLERNDGILIIGSTNHLERLDPGIAKRPSRFDRKYLFPLPSQEEREAYCEYWRHKLRSNRKIQFPRRLCSAIAGITDKFSFAYMKEAFVATLLVIVAGRAIVEDSGDDLDDLILWVEIKKQIKILRDEM